MNATRTSPCAAALSRAAFFCLALLGVAIGSSASAATAAPEPYAQVVVRLKPGSAIEREHGLSMLQGAADVARVNQRRADALGSRAGIALSAGRALNLRTHVLRARGIDSATLALRLASDPNVLSVSIDRRVQALRVPNDPLYAEDAGRTAGPVSGQWYFHPPLDVSPEPAGGQVRSSVNAEGAWDRTLGSPGIVVAVLDTGILADHLDLDPTHSGHVLPGYDMISDPATANDGNGRDSDASDPGDWIAAAEANLAGGPFYGCTTLNPTTGLYSAQNSSWHGTMTAALIGAGFDNGIGMAGIAPGVRILPVRVLGKCGGRESDIAAGLLWAAGIDQPGLPGSSTPARVVNMSLGSTKTVSCGDTYQLAIDAVVAKGVAVVASAGNSSGHAVSAPANCAGAIAVAGLRHVGSKVGFSDLGPEIAIAAPGGNCVNVKAGEPCLYPILTATNTGTQGPVAGGSTWTDSTRYSVGTSFSAPIVAGTVALMLSVQPNLSLAEVTSALKSSARAFPTSGAGLAEDGVSPVPACTAPAAVGQTQIDQLQCYCNTAVCGAGMLDASAAVAAAAGTFARIGVTPAAPVAGTAVALDSAGSLVGAGRSIVGWEWLLVGGGGAVSGFSGAANAASASLLPTAAGTVQVRLTLIDDLGGRTSVDRSIVVAAAPVPPVTPPSSGGGGGAFSGVWLIGLALAVLCLALERRRRRD